MRTIQHHTVSMPQTVYLRAASVELEGEIYIPDSARGVVLFVHGAGSSRHSPRDRAIAEQLHRAHFATFLFDLLTPEEEARDLQTLEFRLNVGLLAKRVAEVADSLTRDPGVRGLPLAYIATGTGAAAALLAATKKPACAAAVISRGGRPDLAEAALSRVAVPTLLIVGGEDRETLKFNRKALSLMRCEKDLRIVAGAGHLFEEPGAIDTVESLVLDWLQHHLQPELAAR